MVAVSGARLVGVARVVPKPDAAVYVVDPSAVRGRVRALRVSAVATGERRSVAALQVDVGVEGVVGVVG